MDSPDANKQEQIDEFMDRTRDFIAYFNLIENKLEHWCQDMDSRQQKNAQIVSQLSKWLDQHDLSALQTHLKSTLDQGKQQLQQIHSVSQQVQESMQKQQQQLQRWTNESLQKIESQTQKLMQTMEKQFARYDVHHFHRIASESCDQVEKVAQDAVGKSTRLLNMFQWRFSLLTITTTLITAFILGMYISDELPWETHKQAYHERQAGQLLLQAWSDLSHHEKAKILKYEQARNG